MFIEMYVEIYD